MKRCFICRSWCYTERHHIFGGALRGKSQRYALTVDLCPQCHRTAPASAHRCAETAQLLHEYGQRKAMEENGWTTEDFRREFYKNYI